MYYDAGTSVAPSIVSITPSVLALRRLDEHRTSRVDASYYYDDEIDDNEDDFDLNVKSIQANHFSKNVQKMESSLEEFQNNRFVIDNKRDDTPRYDMFSPAYGYHGHEQEEEIDEQLPTINAFDDAASLLQNFNFAVSSYTGSYYASSHSGSHFSASEQQSAPRKSGQAQKLKSQRFRDSAINRLQGFSFPEDNQYTIREDMSEEIQDHDSSTNMSVAVSDEGEFT